MTQDEAMNTLYSIRADNLNLNDLHTKEKYDALSMAIKALEEQSMLDKIKAEITEIAVEEMRIEERWARGLYYAIKVIDKYTSLTGAESEDKKWS